MNGNRPVTLILLAAGDSRRFDGNKLLYPLEGKPLYRHLADRMAALKGSIFEKICLVSQYEEILAGAREMGFEVCRNDRSDLGISHSVHLGLSMAGEEDVCCFAVCDQPWLKAETVRGLVEGFLRSGKGLGCLGCRERAGDKILLGNPAIFAPGYRRELLALTGDVGGRKIIKKHSEDLYVFQVPDAAELEDVDTRSQLPAASTYSSAPSEE